MLQYDKTMHKFHRLKCPDKVSKAKTLHSSVCSPLQDMCWAVVLRKKIKTEIRWQKLFRWQNFFHNFFVYVFTSSACQREPRLLKPSKKMTPQLNKETNLTQVSQQDSKEI